MSYPPLRYPNGWILLGYAQQRLDEMGITASGVFAALGASTLTYPGHPDRWGRPRQVHVGGGLAVITTPCQQLVVTVLWHGATGRDVMGQAA